MPVPEWMSDLAKRGGDAFNGADHSKEKAEQDARWVGEWSDDLIVAIALREWTKAVDLVEQGAFLNFWIIRISCIYPHIRPGSCINRPHFSGQTPVSD